MPREVAPPSYPAFRAYFEEQLTREEAYLTDEARYVGAAIMFEIPVPATHWPAMRAHNLIMLGSLPRGIRELYGLRWTPAQAAAFRALVAAVRAPRPLTPRRLRTGWNTIFVDLVARTERGRVARGKPTPGLPA
jgi:uncharacterized protein (DUF2236 family)